ncbi:MAG TPA: hypothetical protein VNU49_00555 [Opitutaceae bacterium]|jgi:hypothetical protein|nr:hypothetical protein [Opitutaceae bacterium]
MMVPFMAFGLFALAIVAVVGLAIWAGRVQKQRTTDNLQKLATQLGLEFVAATGWTGQPRVTGALRGKKTDFFTFVTSTGKSSTTWAAVTVQAATAGALTFALEKRGFVTKIEKLFGAHEAVVDDADFSKAWFVQTNQPDFMSVALIPELRVKLMAARQAGSNGKFELKGGQVKYVEMGSFSEVKRSERFAALADVMCDLADVAEVAAEGQGKAEPNG